MTKSDKAAELVAEYMDLVEWRQFWIGIYLVLLTAALGFVSITVLSQTGAPDSEVRELALAFQYIVYIPPGVILGEPLLHMGLIRIFPQVEGKDFQDLVGESNSKEAEDAE